LFQHLIERAIPKNRREHSQFHCCISLGRAPSIPYQCEGARPVNRLGTCRFETESRRGQNQNPGGCRASRFSILCGGKTKPVCQRATAVSMTQTRPRRWGSHIINIADLRVAAERRIPKVVFDYLDGGADREVTLKENCRVFDEVIFRPRQ